MHTVAELTGWPSNVVWLEFFQWYVEDLHDAEFGACALPDDVGAGVRSAASPTGTTPEAIWHASTTSASAVLPYFR